MPARCVWCIYDCPDPETAPCLVDDDEPEPEPEPDPPTYTDVIRDLADWRPNP